MSRQVSLCVKQFILRTKVSMSKAKVQISKTQKFIHISHIYKLKSDVNADSEVKNYLNI